MEETFDSERAAAGLAMAWRNGLQPAALRQEVRPPTLADGYHIQDRLIDLLGHPVVGWKVGMAGRNAYRAAGLERPVFGRVLGPRCFVNGDVVVVPRDRIVTVELELVLVIAEDVHAGAEITTGMIQSAHLGFEIVCSRLPDRQSIGVAATVADNTVSHAVVLGEAVDFASFAELAAQAMVIADRKAAASGLRGDDLPDPLAVLGHLIAHLAERGRTLRRGDVVFTGTLTKPFDIAAPSELIGGSPEPKVWCRLEPAS